MGWRERLVMVSSRWTQKENSSLFMTRFVRRHTISFPTQIRSRYVLFNACFAYFAAPYVS